MPFGAQGMTSEVGFSSACYGSRTCPPIIICLFRYFTRLRVIDFARAFDRISLQEQVSLQRYG